MLETYLIQGMLFKDTKWLPHVRFSLERKQLGHYLNVENKDSESMRHIENIKVVESTVKSIHMHSQWLLSHKVTKTLGKTSGNDCHT